MSLFITAGCGRELFTISNKVGKVSYSCCLILCPSCALRRFPRRADLRARHRVSAVRWQRAQGEQDVPRSGSEAVGCTARLSAQRVCGGLSLPRAHGDHTRGSQPGVFICRSTIRSADVPWGRQSCWQRTAAGSQKQHLPRLHALLQHTPPSRAPRAGCHTTFTLLICPSTSNVRPV